jgi:16S rRNA (guanine527-N7)-methyltransferase
MGDGNWQNFTRQVLDLGCNLTTEQLTKFQKYYQLLLQWNNKINLVSRKDTERLISFHFVDSLLVLNDIPTKAKVCDLGSGAGLPGIPLKIMRDDIILFLVESIQKKAAFLRLCVEELNFKDVTVYAERAEKITDLKCDIILIRLLGKIKKIVPLCYHLLAPQGKIIFYKSKTAFTEVEEAKRVLTRFSLKSTIREIRLPKTDIIRRLVYLSRINKTVIR